MKNKNSDDLLIERLVSKSQEAFLMALEIINKPTIKYRSEGFNYYLINAWELLLKAQIANTEGTIEIYYKKNLDRTLSITSCVDKVYTDFKNPIKANLKVLIKLRDESTHFISPDYDNLYSSFFQASIFFYIEQLKEFFNVNINDSLPNNFIAIATNVSDIDSVKVTQELDKPTFDRFIRAKKDLTLEAEHDGIRIGVEVRLKNVKKGEDFTFKFDKNGTMSGQIIKEIQDPSNTHPYRSIEVIQEVNKRVTSEDNKINTYDFTCIKKQENIESSLDYFYQHKASNTKTYSNKTIDLIVTKLNEVINYKEICRNSYKKDTKDNKKNSPRS